MTNDAEELVGLYSEVSFISGTKKSRPLGGRDETFFK
jgi:hypothetical protein